MLSFKKLSLDDIDIVRTFFDKFPCRLCDCTVGSTFMWRDYFHNCFSVYHDTLIMRSGLPGKRQAYSYPIGLNPEDAFDALEEYCRKNSTPLVFASVPQDKLELLRARYPECIYSYSEDWQDYLYESEAIAGLRGRKYSTQRNHINKFLKLYPDFLFEPLTDENLPDVLEFLDNFTFHSEKEGNSAELEIKMCAEVAANHNIYDMPAAVLYVGGKVIGLSIGEIVGDTLFCHIEKANAEYHGAYPMLTHLFLERFLTPEVRFVNREEDVGDEGLRRSKQAYHPIEMLRKYTVTIKE